jgi:hypothetical protein
MADPEVKTWEEELTEIIRSRTERETALRTTRENLRFLLENRFGTLPPEWVNRIEQVNELPRLKASLAQVLDLK